MSLNEIEEFERKIEYFVKQNKIINIEEVSLYRRKRSIIEKLYSHIFWIKYDLKYFLNQK